MGRPSGNESALPCRELRGPLPRSRPGPVPAQPPQRAGVILGEPRLERAIGVIYRPETERASHYFHASLPAQFDAVLHFDRTRAVEPLERTAAWEKDEVPETFPSGV